MAFCKRYSVFAFLNSTRIYGNNLVICFFIFLNPILAYGQIIHEINDYRSIGSGDYNNPAFWQVWDGVAWIAASVKPERNNNIFIDQGHEMRLIQNEEAKNVYLYSAATPGRKLNLQTFELQVYGALRAIERLGADFILNNVTNASTDWIYPETGKIVFRGSTRTVVDRPSWSATNTNSRFTVVFNPDPGATLTVNSAFKANAFIIQSGTVIQTVNTMGIAACSTFSFNNQAVFNGSGPYGNFVIEPGATFISQCYAPLDQIIRRSTSIPAALFHLKPGANLILLANDPTMDVAEFRFEGNVYYRSNSGNQRLVRTTFATSGNPKTYNNILFENPSNKLLPDSLFLNGDFARLTGGNILENPSYLRFQGSGIQQVIGFDMDINQLEVNKPSGSLLFYADVKSKTNFIMKNGQVDFSGFDLYVNTSGGGSLSYQGGKWLNLNHLYYNNIPSILTTENATFPFEDLYQGGTRKIQLLGNSPGGNISARFLEIPGRNDDPNYDDIDGTPILYQLNSYFEFSGLSPSTNPIEMRISADNLVVDDVDDLRITGNGLAAQGNHLPGLDPSLLWARREIEFGAINNNTFTVGSFRLLSVLPVNWLEMKAEFNKREINISWSTAQESNNQKFYINRSIGNIENFETIGEIASKGDADEIQHYQFSYFEKTVSKHVYFQLEQVDFDGKKSSSKVFKLEGKKENDQKMKATIWPNPYESGPIQIELPEKVHKQGFSVRISDMKGLHFLFEEYSQIQLEEFLEKLQPGVYLIEFVSLEKKYVLKLIKK
ncbi:T9SS type A sorting domain-containing protein [Aquiflexum gelatinilyticum]|uniref:T9SS type A sorting domain-containing protein n=1 Tax=Aquiflexum gelatinilyticum TaxID=2961943 RepID=A0A9X2P813_9BACT|nr:T9SS type A sorting domain-containing protein [Aquiflexum gelatinilyticum]MCR9015192.1 T9SS type A sorting domain-containing protein [Aquiflexum gelatinilyticum]